VAALKPVRRATAQVDNPSVHPTSVLIVTLDSCRYDTLAAAAVPAIRELGPVHRAMAPGHFTYASHLAIFVGFTPGIATAQEPLLNPKYGRIFRLAGSASTTRQAPFVTLTGRTIVQGFRRRGYRTIGSASMRWFNPESDASKPLIEDFQDFYYVGPNVGSGVGVEGQVTFVQRSIDRARGRPVFVFLNVGETHTPYYHTGAPWDPTVNPCQPFGQDNDAEECRRRQLGCLEFVDQALRPLLGRFATANVVVCSDHGDAWGEDGVWEHGISHPKVLEVPLIFRLATPIPPLQASSALSPAARVSRRLRRMRHRPT